MAITAAELEVIVSVDDTPFRTGMAALQRTALSATSGVVGSFANLKTTIMGLSPLALTAATGIGAAFVGTAALIGKVAFDAAEEFDAAFDKIRVATGATGADAAKLQEVFRSVFTSIPTTADKAAEAIGFLSARLGVTGTDLENLAKQELEFARITGTSLSEALNSTSRLFKDFQDSIKSPGEALDFLFKVSQQTGTELTKVAQSLVSYGAPLRGLGFDFKEAAALTAKFTAEGVELGKVLPGMRQALANLADEGVKDAGEAFRILIERIQALPTPMEQVQAAVEIFGKRAGPDLAEAIRQGRFSIDELIKTVDGSKETIIGAAAATNDYGESWRLLQNQVSAALEPMGTQVRDVISKMAAVLLTHKDDLIALGKKVAEISGAYIEAMNSMGKAVADLVASVQTSNEKHKDSWGGLFDALVSAADKFAHDMKSKMLLNTVVFLTLTDIIQKFVDDTKAQFKILVLAAVVMNQAFHAIEESIIGPFRRALEWLQQSASKFRAAFEAITTAGRIGLVVKSPPIVAQWVEMIGAAAVKAAATTKSSVPSFTDSYKTLTAAAKTHLPAVAQEWLNLATTVIDVIEKIRKATSKDVFGSAGSGSGGSGGGDTTQGGFLGGLAKFASAVGSIANIFSGVDSIIKSIKSIFGIKSAFQKAMEAEQVAQARLQTQQMKLDIEKTAQEVIQAAVASFQKALEFFDQLDAFTPVRKAKFKEFFANMSRLMKYFLELAQSWSITSLAQAKAAAESIGPVAEAISQFPAAFDAINGHFGVAESSIDRFFLDFDRVMTAFFNRIESWAVGKAKHARKIAENIAPAISLMGPIIEAIKNMSSLSQPPDAAFDIIDNVLETIVTRVSALSAKFDKALLKVMANFAEKAGGALSIWKEAIESIRATVDVPPPSAADVDNVVSGIELFINKLGGAVERLTNTDLTRVAAFANVIAPIAAAIKAWAETADVVRGYTAVAAEVWEQIVTDFERGLVLLNLLILDAQLYVDKANTFKNLISQGASTIASALSTYAGSISSAASTLAAGLPQGGTPVGGPAPSSQMAPKSRGPMSLTLVLQPGDPRTQAVVNFVEQVFGASVLNSTPNQFA